ncbi:exportin-T-like [Apostichopus japonicus]|uniref:exportin-T-like n=1 Tax=Stichopus japonicus TaxID=307972 RepID=UPI003AB847D4
MEMDEVALQGLGPFATTESQRRALAYFEEMKQSEIGWQLCANAILAKKYDNDHIKFFCFQVVEHFIKDKYSTASQEDRLNIQNLLITWLQMSAYAPTEEKMFIKNKVAQLFSLVFVQDYLNHWPTFFQDLLQYLSHGPPVIDVFLRILLAIDIEVVDRDIAHTPEETQRNTLLKDTMRVQCVPALVDSWYQILKTYESQNPELTCLCLEVIGCYVSWIDIGLIANEHFIERMLNHLTVEALRESACDCFCEIINKGMDSVAKVELIESVSNVLQTAGVLPPNYEDDVDYLAKLSNLISDMGCQLIGCWQRLSKEGTIENTGNALRAIQGKLTFMFAFLGHEDDDVSLATMDFTKEYIGLLKQVGSSAILSQFGMEDLLKVVMKKFEYDDSYNFDSQGEDEVMFLDYRKQMMVLFVNLAKLNQELVLNCVHQLLEMTLSQWKNVTFTQCELAIAMFYNLGEAIPPVQGNQFTWKEETVMHKCMVLLMESGVSQHTHWAVQLQYFETVARYEKFFSASQEHIPAALSAFLDERGIRNQKGTVRSRCAYLFGRFMKQLKGLVAPYAEDILQRIPDLLTIQTPENGHHQILTTDDQLFLYEAAGIIIISSTLPVEKKQLLMNNLLATTIEKFQTMYTRLHSETDEAKQVMFAEVINHAIACASRSSKAFHTQLTMKQSGLLACYVEALKVFLCALETPYQHQLIHSAVRQFLHRMIVCLGDAILPYVPIAVDHLLKKGDVKDVHDFIPLINQIVSKFKKTIIPFLQEAFMPVVQHIFSVLSQPTDELDMQTQIEKDALQRSFFQFLQGLIANDVLEVISNQSPDNFRQVLITVAEAAVDGKDPVSQKVCFNIVKRLLEVWGGKNGIPVFRDYTYEYIIPACFMAPLKRNFDLTDAQTVLALTEMSSVLNLLFTKEGADFIQFLQSKYFPSISLPADTSQAFCNAVSEMDPKIFKDYFKHFIGSLRKT